MEGTTSATARRPLGHDVRFDEPGKKPRKSSTCEADSKGILVALQGFEPRTCGL